jgi:hypothetical protein
VLWWMKLTPPKAAMNNATEPMIGQMLPCGT